MDKLYIFCQFDNSFNICYNRQCVLKKVQGKKYRRIVVKKVLKGIIIVSIIVLALVFNAESAKALRKVIAAHQSIEIYEVKENVRNIVELYEVDPNKEEVLRYREEQERIEQERIEQERLSNLREEIVNFSIQFIGNPYVSGGTSLIYGADCSGFVQAVYANFGYSLPRTTYEQAMIGDGMSMEEIKIGDIVSYGYNGYATHSALYIGDGMIIHASTPELGIRLDRIDIMPIITIRNII